MLDIERLRALRWHSAPFRWCVDDHLLDPAAVAVLAGTFPDARFVDIERPSGTAGHDKPYRMRLRSVVDGGRLIDGELEGPWTELVNGLASPAYAAALAAAARINGDGDELVVDVNLWRYGCGSWLGPHPDKPTKLASHVVYLSPSWETEWGGGLRILRSGASDDVHEVVVPTPGRSVLIATSPTSWHEVAPIEGAPGVERCSVTINLRRRAA